MTAELESLVSPYVGIVRWVDSMLVSPNDARIHRVVCESSDPSCLGLSGGVTHSGGFGASYERARASALGEAAERYGLLHAQRGVGPFSAAELPRATDPASYALFDSAQHTASFPYVPFTRDTPVCWVEATALSTSTPAFVPAQLVYLGRRLEDGESPIAYSTSNGAACSQYSERATLNALLEVVERDAFMLAWGARASLPLLDWENHRELSDEALRRFRRTNLSYSVVDLTPFAGVPAALALVRGPGGEAPLGIGAAAATTIETAWSGALCEAFSARAAARIFRESSPRPNLGPDFSGIADFRDHLHAYAYDDMLPRAAFLDASPIRRPVSDIPPVPGKTSGEQLEEVVRRIRGRGYETFAVDVTPDDLRAIGLHVARVLVPGYCALDATHTTRFLGGSRRLRAASEAGYGESVLAPHELNPDPHPFP